MISGMSLRNPNVFDQQIMVGILQALIFGPPVITRGRSGDTKICLTDNAKSSLAGQSMVQRQATLYRHTRQLRTRVCKQTPNKAGNTVSARRQTLLS